MAPTLYRSARPATERGADALGVNVHVDARRVGVRGADTRLTIPSGGSARSARVDGFLKSSAESPRQNAEAKVENPARSCSRRLRKTTSRMESSTGDCGITGAGRVTGGATVPGAAVVAGGRGGVRTLACPGSGTVTNATMAVNATAPSQRLR